MPTREQICSQYPCLSCPLSIGVTGKDCRELTQVDINDIMAFVRAIEYDATSQNITELFEFIRDENKDLKG